MGSSPVARGLSAPLNIPYKVAFVLDVAGDNEALVARNGSGVDTIAELKGKRVGTPFASTAHYSLLAALDPERVVRQRCSTGRPAAAGDPGGVGARRHRRRLHLAADAGPAAQDRQGPDHQPPAGQGRQADAGPRRGVATSSPPRIRRSSTHGVKQEARALNVIHDDPGRGSQGDRRRDRAVARRMSPAS